MSRHTQHMGTFVDYFAASVALGTAISFGVRRAMSEVDSVRSTVDNRKYLVQDLPNKVEAADFLARITLACEDLVDRLRRRYPTDERVLRLVRRFDPRNISEGSAKSGYTSYSVNKGEKIVVCIRQSDNTFADANDVMYVVIHELGHLATAEIGHTKKFWSNFRFLLLHAVDYGIYRHKDYRKNPADYCGIKLSSNIIEAPATARRA